MRIKYELNLSAGSPRSLIFPLSFLLPFFVVAKL